MTDTQEQGEYDAEGLVNALVSALEGAHGVRKTRWTRDVEEAYEAIFSCLRARQGRANVGASKFMWIVGDGQLFEHDDREAAEEWAKFSGSDGPTLVHVTPFEEPSHD